MSNKKGQESLALNQTVKTIVVIGAFLIILAIVYIIIKRVMG